MKRKQIHTIILQEARIAELTERNRQLESGHSDLWRKNKKLQLRIKFLERQENELSKVNI